MFHFVRVLLSTLVYIGILYCVGRIRIMKRTLRIAGIIAVLLLFAMYIYPVENLFYSFDSPVAVCRYKGKCSRKDEPLVIYGKETDLVIIDKGSTTEIELVPKTADGSKIGTVTGGFRSAAEADGVSISVYHQKKYVDHYIIVSYLSDSADGQTEIYDSEGSRFYAATEDTALEGQTAVSCYACVQDCGDTYWICINGQKLYPKMDIT